MTLIASVSDRQNYKVSDHQFALAIRGFSLKNNFTVANDVFITTVTFGQGDAGRIDIQAGNTVSLTNRNLASGSFSFREIVTFVDRLGLLHQVGGVSTEQVADLLNRFPATVGSANDITVNARVLRLDQQAGLLSNSGSGRGGNIRLKLSDALLLRRGSQISTNAGTLLELLTRQ